MRRIGRVVHAVAGAAALVEMVLPGPARPAPLFDDPRYGSCSELVVRLEAGAWFDDHGYDAFGQVLILHGTDEAYRLTEADAGCIAGSGQLSRLVRADVESHRANQASECLSLAVAPGADEIRRHVQVDAVALAAYRDEVCAGPVPSLLLDE
jgi:hypothetical protein